MAAYMRPEVQFSSNISSEHRATILDFDKHIMRGPATFARTIAAHIELREVEVFTREEDGKTQARVVFEMPMLEDMLNVAGNLHGGCSMYLIDTCSLTALHVLRIVLDKKEGFVSQAINTVFHAPTSLGSRLKIVNTTVVFGSRIFSARTEIWDMTNRRLVATGVQNMVLYVPRL
ncbi:HotDog domain-containing protein [Earliella scabrosa]|nr:HotDog domain-containing protein [Earliella scabrosa]